MGVKGKRKFTSNTVRKDYKKRPSWTDAECADYMYVTQMTITNRRLKGELPLAEDFHPFRISAAGIRKMAKLKKEQKA